MQNNKILLSSGSFPWLNISQISSLARMKGFSGVELVPTRSNMSELQAAAQEKDTEAMKKKLLTVLSFHHTWRLDVKNDAENGIDKKNTILYSIIRLAFFPPTKIVRESFSHILHKLRIPLTVHRFETDWIHDSYGNEFRTDILLELLNTDMTKGELKDWLKGNNHFLVLDTRDDQSVQWAKTHGFSDWKSFWEWITLQKIKSLQVSLIGTDGMKKIFKKKPVLAEEQLLWLNGKKWQGSIILEINPLSLFLATKGDMNGGLESLRMFIEQTLIHGEKWSD